MNLACHYGHHCLNEKFCNQQTNMQLLLVSQSILIQRFHVKSNCFFCQFLSIYIQIKEITGEALITLTMIQYFRYIKYKILNTLPN